MPTPPAKWTDIDSRPAEKQLADCAHIECETNAHKTGEKEADGCLLQLPEPDPEPDSEFNATTPPSAVHMEYIEKENTHLDVETEAKIRCKGYNVEEIQDYVGQLTERPLQWNLKHPDRNQHINRCVYTSFDNKRHLVCDFDDLVISLTLDWNCKWTGKKHWFVKQDPFRMPLHNCTLLYTLQLEQPTDQTKFKEQLEVVMDESEFVLDMVRAFLGWQNCVLRTKWSC